MKTNEYSFNSEKSDLSIMVDNSVLNQHRVAKAMDSNLSIKMVNSVNLGPVVSSIPMKPPGISLSKAGWAVSTEHSMNSFGFYQTPEQLLSACHYEVLIYWVIKVFN